MAKTRDWVLGIIIVGSVLLVLSLFLIGFWGISSQDGGTLHVSGERIGVVELNGIILSSDQIVRQLEKMRESTNIRAVVLRIDSPGGGVAASQEIYEAVKAIRDKGKPIVVSMGSVAASGGYYVACGADTIVANPGTTTGSIGVILEVPNIEGLLSKLGIRYQVVKSGPFKDSGSPFREMTERERRYFQAYIDDAFDQFVAVVAENRGMTKEDVKALADGRVFTGRQAFTFGLVDTLGDFNTAVAIAANMAGLKGKPKLYRIPKRKITILDLLFSDINEAATKIGLVPALKYQMHFGTAVQ